MSSESVAAVKGKVRLYYERFPSFREKKRKVTTKKKNINHLHYFLSPKTEQMLAHSGVKLPLSIYRTIHIPQITHRKLNSFLSGNTTCTTTTLFVDGFLKGLSLKKSFNLMFKFKGIMSHNVSNHCHIMCIATYL